LVTEDVIRRIKLLQTPFADTICELLEFFAQSYKDYFGFDRPPLHDPCAVAYCIDPTLFEEKLMRVVRFLFFVSLENRHSHSRKMHQDIEKCSSLSYGQTVCDIYNMSKLPKNCHVCLRMDVGRFWDLFLTTLTAANLKSSLNQRSKL